MSYEIEIPEYADGSTKHTIIGDKIIFVLTDTDSDTNNPLEEEDGIGHIYSFNSRHINYNPAKIKALTTVGEDYEPDAIELSYYEHGRCLWFVAGTTAPAGVEFQWDGRRLAGIWIPDDVIRESCQFPIGSPARREYMIKQAISACDIYTQWCNGDIFGYSIEAYKLAVDQDGDPVIESEHYKGKDSVFSDSCWGFFGTESLEQEVKQACEGFLAEQEVKT